MNRTTAILLPLLVVAGLAACGGSDGDNAAGRSMSTAVHSKPEISDVEMPDAPAVPIDIDYEILGVPVVGIPLSINVTVSSELDEPITINYRINDSTSLVFNEAQSEKVSLVPAGDQEYAAEQVTVIPQREGRLFLNVSAEIENDSGTMARLMAIPIQVGSLRAVPRINGNTSPESEN